MCQLVYGIFPLDLISIDRAAHICATVKHTLEFIISSIYQVPYKEYSIFVTKNIVSPCFSFGSEG